MTPRVLQPEELRNYWPFIKQGLEKILEKDSRQDWIPEDVYSAIKSRQSVCVIGLINDKENGFFVGYPMKDRTFFAWAIWCEKDMFSGEQILVEYAKSLNCNQIKFGTGRQGWNRVARKLGYKPSIWVKEI